MGQDYVFSKKILIILMNKIIIIGGVKCSPEQILRKSYTTKKGVYVKPTCVKDRGNKGKSPNILPPIDKNISLSKYGYSTFEPQISRQKAIKKTIRNYQKNKKYDKRQAAMKVMKRMVLISNYSKSNKKVHQTLKKDIKFIRQKYL